MDIGQTVIVKDKSVLAVESIEGTDETVRRGGSYGKSGCVMVKVSKPNQDFRFDMPVIGPYTVKTAVESGISCIAIDAGASIILNRSEAISSADESGVCITAV